METITYVKFNQVAAFSHVILSTHSDLRCLSIRSEMRKGMSPAPGERHGEAPGGCCLV